MVARMPAQDQLPADRSRIIRIGILQCIPKIDDSALRYLILSMNALQQSFQLEFVPFDPGDKFLSTLLARDPVDRLWIIGEMGSFFLRQRQYFERKADDYQQPKDPPDCFQIISIASFRDNYFYT